MSAPGCFVTSNAISNIHSIGTVPSFAIFLAIMPPKRVSNLSGNSYVSKSALATILRSVKENPQVYEESGLSRHAVKRKRDAEIDVDTQYGKVIQTLELPLAAGRTLKLSLLSLGNTCIFLFCYRRNFVK